MTDALAVTPHTISFRRVLSTRGSWAILLVVVVGLLSYGSIHPPVKTATQRINDLESIIKCPPCADISIAQSDDQQAKTLRTSVAQWVHQGWSDTRIENEVVALYGSNEILQPKTTGIDVLVWLVPLVAILLGIIGVGYVLFRRKKTEVPTGDVFDDELIVARARDDRSSRQ